MSLRVISHEPNINATDVPINATIKVKFSNGIIGSSVSHMTFTVNDAQYFTSVPGELGVEFSQVENDGVVENIMDTVVFTPDIKFNPNTKYNVYIYGQPNSIIGTDNSGLASSYIFEFTTGTTEINDDGSTGIPDDVVTTSPGILNVININPKHQDTNIRTDTQTIDIVFNAPITSTIEELNELISLDIKDVLF